MARWKRLFMVSMLVSLLSGVLVLLAAGSPARQTAATAQSGPAPVNDGYLLQYAQSISGSQRSVLLTWRAREGAPYAVFLPSLMRDGAASASRTSPAPRPPAQAEAASYTVFRRTVGQTGWQALETVTPAGDELEMVSRIGRELTDFFAEAFKPAGQTPPLTDLELYQRMMSGDSDMRLYSERFYQIGLVRGTAYMDKLSKLDDLEYYVAGPELVRFNPVRVRASDLLDPPAGLTEVFPGPDALGKPNSSYPDSSPERWDYLAYNQLRGWDGSVSLYWQTPTGNPGDPVQGADSQDAMGMIGYYVYRASKGSASWSMVNPTAWSAAAGDACGKLVSGKPYLCYQPIRASALHSETIGVDYYHFRDLLKEQYTDPQLIYGSWDYKVCAADALGGESCSARITATSRDLNPPDHPTGLIVDQPDGGPVAISWTYQTTREVSGPLRFYVTRHQTLTTPLEQWEPVYPQGSALPYQTAALADSIALSITDSPPTNIPYWYKIQVRDGAGNFSAESAPTMGALFNRKPPALGDIPYDKSNCALNPWPLSISGLKDSVWAVAVNRGLTPTGPWTYISSAPVQNGAAEIFDGYQPPVGRDVYYALEAVDVNGNVSPPEYYCVWLDAHAAPPPPVTDQGDPFYEGGGWHVPVTFTGTTSTAEITLVEQGMVGTITTTVSGAASPYNQTVNLGAWVETIVATQDGIWGSNGTSVTAHVTNDFLNTKRQMTDLGQIHSLTWVTGTNGLPAVALDLTGTCDGCRSQPLVAAFRRIPGGSWFQVTPVQSIPRPSLDANWIITDTTDLSPGESYEYVVMAFSPDSGEALGFWGPSSIGYQVKNLPPVALTPWMSDGPTWPGACGSYDSFRPSSIGMTDVISFTNGWYFRVRMYWDGGTGTPCDGIDPSRLYGDGHLTNGVDTYATTFANLGIDGSGQLISGRFVYNLNQTVTAPDQFTYHMGRLEFTPAQASAEITLTLPADLNAELTGQARSNQLYYVAPGLSTSYQVPTFIQDDLRVINENLPWAIQFRSARINWQSVSLQRGEEAASADRYNYNPPSTVSPAAPDNNLAFMRARYVSPDFVINSAGMQGSFATSDAIQYATSQPASVLLSADGAALEIVDSAIAGGALTNGSARLDYLDQETSRDYMLKDGRCGGADSVVGYAWCHGTFQSQPPSLRTLNLTPADPDIVLGAGGVFTPEVVLSQPPAWTVYQVHTDRGTLFVAPGAFPDAPTSFAPMPAENGWSRLPANFWFGELDPGLNIIQDSETADYDCYTPPAFPWSRTELYIRRGGVSEYFLTGEDTPSDRVNDNNYLEKVHQAELSLLDNSEEPLDYRTDLTLPYPSMVLYPLAITGIDSQSHCPATGDIRVPTTVTHRFWKFQETPDNVVYVPVGGKYGTLPATQKKLLMVNGSALIDGLHPQSTSGPALPVSRQLSAEWFPDGDAGDLRLASGGLPAEGYRVAGLPFALSDVKLSRYHTIPMDPASKPDTALIQLANNAMELPAALLSGGSLTPDSILACSNTAVDGCGFILLDGEGMVSYMGQIQQFGVTGSQPLSTTGLPVDELVGKFPVVANKVLDRVVNMAVNHPSFHLIWPTGSAIINAGFEYFDLPIRFLANAYGGALVGVIEHASILPGSLPEIFNSDLAATVTIDWNSRRGYGNQVGVYAGYPASQAAFRALALNRPRLDQAGVKPFDRWTDVETDIHKWAGIFGYQLDPGPDNSKDDPVDLAQRIWESGWCASWTPDAADPARVCAQPVADLSQTYGILEPIMKDMNGANEYGGIGLKSGQALLTADTILSDGGGQVIFSPAGLANWRFDGFYAGTRLKIASDNPYQDAHLIADWLSLSFTRDGIITFEGQKVKSIMLSDWGMESDILFIANVNPGNEHVEGGIETSLEVPLLFKTEIAGVFGGGIYDGEIAGFLGFRGSKVDLLLAPTDNQTSIMLIGGMLPADSVVIRAFGFGEVLDKFNKEDTGGHAPYTGGYFALGGDWELMGKLCPFEVRGGGEFRGWFFVSDQGDYKGGGQLEAHISASILCVLHGRGQLTLSMEKLLDQEPVSSPDPDDPNWGPLPRYCDNDYSGDIQALKGCQALTGSFWVAIGAGWCSPGTWHQWSGTNRGNWWGDDWCYTFGANVGVSWLWPGDTHGDQWDWEIDLKFE